MKFFKPCGVNRSGAQPTLFQTGRCPTHNILRYSVGGAIIELAVLHTDNTGTCRVNQTFKVNRAADVVGTQRGNLLHTLLHRVKVPLACLVVFFGSRPTIVTENLLVISKG